MQKRSAILSNPQLELFEYLPYLINRVGVALVERFERKTLKRHHLNIAMWRVLVALSRRPEQRQIDLALKTSIEVSTMSRLVTRSVRMGLVTRTRSNNSSREVLVSLSSKGRALVDRLIPMAMALEKDVVAGFSEIELVTVRKILQRMYQNLTADQESS